ncbi:alpha/beta-hydrolase [Clavulina sp. PMI_390]|nr:alpha/beta-hydrolase [Clavulina sp. PMI_390]
MSTDVAKDVSLSVVADAKVDDALDNDGDDIIRNFCKPFGIDFEPLSELNNTSSAFAGVFWDPKSNWIVIAFKGTSPIEFGEILSDLNTKMVSVGSSIPGFKKVHKGFRDRVYPEDVTKTGGVRPYDTILAGVKALAKWLRQNNGLPGRPKINIWTTGHSLGCATASLVYCRFLMRPKDLGKKSVLRDAYLFACPILSDRDTVDVFNAKMSEDPAKPKTMWRITSNWDAVATCLPELGDYTSIAVSTNNAFAFAHLGTELKLRNYPLMPNATGNHLYYGVNIFMETKFTKDEILAQRATALAKSGEQQRIRLGDWLQAIPIMGRAIAHSCVNYWDQLNRIGFEGACEWVVD